MNKPRILVIHADPGEQPAYQSALAKLGSPEVHFEAGVAGAAQRLENEPLDLVIAALDIAECADATEIEKFRGGPRRLPLIVVSKHPNPNAALTSLRLGAGDYLAAPIDPGQLVASVRRLLGERRLEDENALLRRQVERPYTFDDIIGACPAMRKVFSTVEQVAASDVDVLVVGETGTGKELIARSLHRRSGRAQQPFVPVDCGAIPESLLESEFFGHEKGSFTGADTRRIGLLEFADRGTFFLDELGELPLLLQAKLLRTLQERKIRRVGGREEIDIDVRIVAATARPLDEMIRGERFRQDLYYRINVVRIDLPPLRERGDDIGLIAEYMANRYGREMGRNVRGITPEAYQVLTHYRWPGNVRELQNVVRRGIALAQGPMIGLDDLPDEVIAAAGTHENGAVGYFQLRDQHVARFERQYLSDLLSRHQGDVKTAAMEAQLPRGTLYRLMKNHGLDGGSFR